MLRYYVYSHENEKRHIHESERRRKRRVCVCVRVEQFIIITFKRRRKREKNTKQMTIKIVARHFNPFSRLLFAPFHTSCHRVCWLNNANHRQERRKKIGYQFWSRKFCSCCSKASKKFSPNDLFSAYLNFATHNIIYRFTIYTHHKELIWLHFLLVSPQQQFMAQQTRSGMETHLNFFEKTKCINDLMHFFLLIPKIAPMSMIKGKKNYS